MKVFHVSHFGIDLPTFGESTLEKVDGDYVRVGKELRHAGFVWPATEDNLALYEAFRQAMTEWKNQEPNPYPVLNQMKRTV